MTQAFIVFEGPDGSGTTTHAKRLGTLLQKTHSVVLTREPTEGKIGQEIRRMLRSGDPLDARKLQELFTADRTEHVKTVIEPALKKGSLLISDRYHLSTIVYGAAQGLDEAWLRSINADFPMPDLTIITLPPLAVCLERLGERATRDQLEEDSFQKRVYDGYANLKERSTVFIDTSGAMDDVTRVILETVEAVLP